MTEDPRIAALPDIHGHAKGEHKAFAEERPIPYTARMLFLWFFHACRRGSPRFLMVADHMNYLTFEDPAAVNLVRRALKLAQAGDLYGAAETAGVEIGHAQVVGEGLRKGMRYSIGAEVDNDPRCRPDAQNIVDAMKPDGTVRSVHFIPITHPQHGENWMWAFDNPEFRDLYDVIGGDAVWEIYMATLLDAIDKLPGNIVGHFYVPAKFGHWPADEVLEGYEDRFIDACAERGMAVEINSRYIYKYFVDDEANLEKFRTVHLRLMRKAKEKNVPIAVGSDAHSPKDQGGAFDAVLALLDEADVNEIAFPIAGRLARVALRATEEILRQHTAALAPPPAPAADIHAAEDDEDDDEPAAAQPLPEPVVAAPKRKRSPAKAPAAVADPVAVADPAASAEFAEAPVAEATVAEAPIAEAPVAEAPVADGAGASPVPVKKPAPRKPRPKSVAAVLEPAASLEEHAADAEAVEERSPLVAVAQTVIDSTLEAVAAVAAKLTKKRPGASSKSAAVESPKAAPKVEKEPPVKAASAKVAPPKVAASKSAPKKPAAKKAAAHPAIAKKSGTAKKSAPAKAASAKKAAPKKAASKKPIAKKPAAKKTVAARGVAKKTAVKKAASKKPAAKKPTAKKPVAKKPVAKKHVVRKPAPKKAVKKAAKRRR